MVVVIHYRDRDQAQVVKVDYSLSNAAPETPLGECARVAKAEHRLEACLQRSKSEAGLAEYEVAIGQGGGIIKRCRYWPLGSWSRKLRGGKKWTPAITLPQMRQGIAVILHEAFQCGTMSQRLQECQKRLQRNELARFYHWKPRNLLAPLNLSKRQC
jgi:hypothetical protein